MVRRPPRMGSALAMAAMALALCTALVCRPAGAEVAVRLVPAASPPAPDAAFLPAVLAIADPNGDLPAVVGAVSLRRREGGTTVLYAVSAAPGGRTTIPVDLPAVSSQQAYTIRLLTREGSAEAPLKVLDASISWPDLGAIEQARRRLVDPDLYSAHAEDLPRWDPATVRGLFLAAAACCAILAGALLIGRAGLRAAAVAALALAAAATMMAMACRQETLVIRRDGPLLVLTCRRTTAWSCPDAGLIPVYGSPRQMDEDDMVYRPGRGFALTIRPEEVRLFRQPAAGDGAASGPVQR